MALINQNSLIGITSITSPSASNVLTVHTNDTTERLRVTANGLSFSGTNASLDTSGNLTVGGNVSVGGTLTYEDVTNIDAVGIITAQAGIRVTGGFIGVGVTPANVLHIKNDSPIIRLESSATSYVGRNTIGQYQSGLYIDCDNDNAISNSFTSFTVDGSEKLRIDSSGRLLIGTPSNDTGDLVQIKNSAGEGIGFYRNSSANDIVNGRLQFHSSIDITSSIEGGHDGSQSAGSSPGRLVFKTTASSATSPTERLRITSDGRVGVGAINPQATLQIGAGFDSGNSQQHGTLLISADNSLHNYIRFTNGGGTETHYPSGIWYQPSGRMELRVASSASASNAAQLVLASNGKIGINDASPIFKLDVVDGAGGANTGANANNPDALSVTGTNRTLTGGGANLFVNSNSDMAADTGGQIALSGRHVTSSTNSMVHATIKGAKETAVSTNTNSYLAFGVSNHNAGALVERLRITSAGDIGIGVGSPEARLHVEENLSHSSTYYLNADAHILVDNPGSGKAVIKLEGEAAIVYGGGSSTLIFADRQNERMRIHASGVVTQPNQPRFFATLSSTYTGYDGRNVGNSWITFNNTIYNEGGHFKTSGGDQGRFVAPVNGMYLFRGSCYKGTGTSNWSQSWLDVDGSRANGTDWVIGSSRHAENSCQIYLTAGQKVGFHPYNNAQNNQIIATGNHTYFRGCLLH